MGNVLDLTTPSNLWAGQHNEQAHGDDIYNQAKFPVRTVKPFGLRNNAITNANFAKYLAEYTQPNTQQQAVNNQVITATGFDFAQFASDNKWLLLGGAAVLAYLFLGGGLGASDRTVTSVTRYSPKASK